MKKVNQKLPFICTFQTEIKDELVKNNYTLISEDNGKYVLLNNGTLQFDADNEVDKEKMTKMCYTNVLCM